jgi:hypothetical protein
LGSFRATLPITNYLSHLRDSIAPLRKQIENHALYQETRTKADLRQFMEVHVFAVWDFMSILKSLQQSLTSVAVPWVPSPYPQACRLINEIVLGEESDAYQGGYLSHFELYLKAMQETGANTGPITKFTGKIRQGVPLGEALAGSGVPESAQAFIRNTFAAIRPEKPHIAAAAFTFGREDLIPAMFREMVRELEEESAGPGVFSYYLERHIEVDGESHGPMSVRMVEDLCRDNSQRWAEATSAAEASLAARLRLWDAVLAGIQRSRAGLSTGRK